MQNIVSKIYKNGGGVVAIAMVLYFVVFSLISLWKYYNFGYNGLDLAIINQAFYNSTLGNWFGSSIHPPSYLGDHFTPILLLLLPIYWLFKNPQSLLILQTLALSLAAWPIYLISKKVLDNKWATFLALAWLLNPFVQNVNLFEFHFLPFATLLILWTAYFYQAKKFLPFVIFSVLALLAREDVALVIAIFGILALLDKRKVKWWLTPIVLSIAYFFLAIKISSLAAPADQYKFLLYYAWLGNSWLEIVKTVVTQPWLLLPRIFSPGSLLVALGLLLPTAYLPLLKPKYLLLSALVYLQLVMGVGWNWLAMILFTQYSSLLLPGIFLATIYGVVNLHKLNFKNQVLQSILKEKWLVMIMVASAIVYSTIFIGPLPGSLAKIASHGLVAPNTRAKQELISQIPPHAAVAATYELLTSLSSRPNIYSLNYVFLGKQQFLFQDYDLPADTQYLAIDYQDLVTYQLQYNKNNFYQNQYNQAVLNWPNVLEGFGLIAIKNSLALYRQGARDNFDLVEAFDQPPEISFSKNNIGDASLKFLGYNKSGNNYQLLWRRELPIKKNYYLQLTLTGTENSQLAYQKIYPLGYGELNAKNNKNKPIIQTNYWFDFSEAVPAGDYNLIIDLIEIGNGGIEVDAVRSTKDVIDIQTTIAEDIIAEKISL